MSYIAEDFREMKPNSEHNFCCGGGGGLNGIGRYREQRNIGLKVKRDQILATGAKLVIAPCHNCWDAIRDLEEVYEIGIRWSFSKTPSDQYGGSARAPEAARGRGRIDRLKCGISRQDAVPTCFWVTRILNNWWVKIVGVA